eukprot:c45644_g1_i1.p1 GENE.c45644_g1_i1~~c45644_g1_i1.p1  ORF type:complete len:518 (-),score=96.64 c45644_g1_i1:57-1610(-)
MFGLFLVVVYATTIVEGAISTRSLSPHTKGIRHFQAHKGDVTIGTSTDFERAAGDKLARVEEMIRTATDKLLASRLIGQARKDAEDNLEHMRADLKLMQSTTNHEAINDLFQAVLLRNEKTSAIAQTQDPAQKTRGGLAKAVISHQSPHKSSPTDRRALESDADKVDGIDEDEVLDRTIESGQDIQSLPNVPVVKTYHMTAETETKETPDVSEVDDSSTSETAGPIQAIENEKHEIPNSEVEGVENSQHTQTPIGEDSTPGAEEVQIEKGMEPANEEPNVEDASQSEVHPVAVDHGIENPSFSHFTHDSENDQNQPTQHHSTPTYIVSHVYSPTGAIHKSQIFVDPSDLSSLGEFQVRDHEQQSIEARPVAQKDFSKRIHDLEKSIKRQPGRESRSILKDLEKAERDVKLLNEGNVGFAQASKISEALKLRSHAIKELAPALASHSKTSAPNKKAAIEKTLNHWESLVPKSNLSGSDKRLVLKNVASIRQDLEQVHPGGKHSNIEVLVKQIRSVLGR